MRITYEQKLIFSSFGAEDLSRQGALDLLQAVEYEDYKGLGRRFITEMIAILAEISDNEYNKIMKENL